LNTIWNKADIHVHTSHSDGIASVHEVLERASATDLKVLAITDHDTIAGALEARALMTERTYPFELIVGCEVSTIMGHVLALFIEQPIQPGMSVEETIAAIHTQGGLAIAAHPYGKLVNSVGKRLEAYARKPEARWRFDALEVFNASLWNADDNDRAAIAAAMLGLPACGGSDSHSLPTIGLGYTCFPGQSAADLQAAIRAGRIQPGGSRWGWRHMRTVAGSFIKRDMRRVWSRAISVTTR
jgi:predicted metal-dependent phosphoesterase TrpH